MPGSAPLLTPSGAARPKTKPVRSSSGVAIVAVMSSPAACPHGKCTFCPGGPDVGSPQSYTGFEPSTMRAKRLDYDPRRIVQGRLGQLARNGHAVDKVDVVVQGGTFPAREEAYQDWLIAGIYAGLNAGPDEDGPAWEDEAAWMVMPADERRRRLARLMQENEAARCRCIGLTIETKPDWCLEEHLDRMLAYGATRVEIGLQALDDGVLKATHRGHTLEDSRRSMQLARDAGFKVCVHMMPGLPRRRHGKAGPRETEGLAPVPESGLPRTPPPTKQELAEVPGSGLPGIPLVPVRSSVGELDPDPAADLDDMRRLFAEPAWRPDMLKVYPTLVVLEGETLLKRQWQEGRYHPYDTAAATALVGEAKGFVPEWCRIQRIDRDIPTTHVEAGVMNSNLRQLAQKWRADRGLPACRCIRCREVARRQAEGRPVSADRLRLVRRDYEAGGGAEAFLSLEDPEADAVVAFVRVRRLGAGAHRPETRLPGGAAFVRELKVYGVAQALGAHDDDPEAGSWQHRGLGARLLAEAERIAFSEWGRGRLLVIAGPGVKPYYRRHGYADVGPYVAKDAPVGLPAPRSRPSSLRSLEAMEGVLDGVPGCIFCAIAAGDVPSAHLYEDGRVTAFLDIKPLAPGHALVVPKRHAAKLEDATPEDRHALMDAAALLAPILCRETGAKDCTIAVNNGPEAGQEVPHVHVHVVPRKASDGAGPIHSMFEGRPNVSSEEMHDLAVKVQTAVEAGGRARAMRTGGR